MQLLMSLNKKLTDKETINKEIIDQASETIDSIKEKRRDGYNINGIDLNGLYSNGLNINGKLGDY